MRDRALRHPVSYCLADEYKAFQLIVFIRILARKESSAETGKGALWVCNKLLQFFSHRAEIVAEIRTGVPN